VKQLAGNIVGAVEAKSGKEGGGVVSGGGGSTVEEDRIRELVARKGRRE